MWKISSFIVDRYQIKLEQTLRFYIDTRLNSDKLNVIIIKYQEHCSNREANLDMKRELIAWDSFFLFLNNLKGLKLSGHHGVKSNPKCAGPKQPKNYFSSRESINTDPLKISIWNSQGLKILLVFAPVSYLFLFTLMLVKFIWAVSPFLPLTWYSSLLMPATSSVKGYSQFTPKIIKNKA